MGHGQGGLGALSLAHLDDLMTELSLVISQGPGDLEIPNDAQTLVLFQGL